MSIPPTKHYFGIPIHTTVNDSIYEFDLVFLEILVKNCVEGMLLTRPICQSDGAIFRRMAI